MGLTIAQKIIKAHLVSGEMTPGSEIALRIDQTLTQDATGTMAYLEFETMGVPRVKTELSVAYIDHNTLQSGFENADDHRFIQSMAKKYGLYFSRPGNGICHQVHLERFGKPGKTLIGSDSHTPTGGGIGMLAMGAGGLDVAVAMGGGAYYITMPKMYKVNLTGKLRDFVTAKDISLEILRILSVKGGVGAIIEWGGEGIKTLSVPERATITNMGTELGATTSIFPSDEVTKAFLEAEGRGDAYVELKSDEDAVYDKVIDIDLSTLKPLIACPHSPDNVVTVESLKGTKVDQVCIGSCTNSSLYDMLKVAALLKGKTIGYDEYPLYVDNIRNAQADMMFDAVTKGEPYRIRMGWIQSTALLTPTCCAQPTGWYEGCKNLEWCMATDCFITPAIEAFADLVLPLASCAEKDDVVMTHYAGSPVTLGSVNKAVDVGEVKSDIQILIELGEYLEMDCLKDEDGGRLFKDEADFLTQRRARPAKMPFEDLRDQVVFQRGVNYRKYETGKLRPDRKPGFLTPTGRVELWSTAYAHYGEDPLPYYQEPAFSPHKDPELAAKYPFILTTGARNYASFHAEHRQIPVLRELHPDPIIEINPEDAAQLGVADGQWVEIRNDYGRAKFKAVVSPIVKKGVVQTDHGWWFPERQADDDARDTILPVGEIVEDHEVQAVINGKEIKDGFVKADHADERGLYGVWQSNVNDLVSNHYNSRLGYGGPYKCNCCSIAPLKESYDTDMDLVVEKFGKLV